MENLITIRKTTLGDLIPGLKIDVIGLIAVI